MSYGDRSNHREHKANRGNAKNIDHCASLARTLFSDMPEVKIEKMVGIQTLIIEGSSESIKTIEAMLPSIDFVKCFARDCATEVVYHDATPSNPGSMDR